MCPAGLFLFPSGVLLSYSYAQKIDYLTIFFGIFFERAIRKTVQNFEFCVLPYGSVCRIHLDTPDVLLPAHTI